MNFEGAPKVEKKELTPKEKCEKEISETREELNQFIAELDALFGNEEGQKLFSKIKAGSFDDSTVDSAGVKGKDAQVIYGDWMPNGNMEGSLYSRYDGNTLRLRLNGEQTLSLNGECGNDFYISSFPEKDGKHGLRPRMIDGHMFVEVGEEGVVTAEAREYDDYLMELKKFQLEKKRREEEQKHVLSRLGALIKKPKPLIEPQEPKYNIIPPEEFAKIIGKIKEGFKKTLETLKEAR